MKTIFFKYYATAFYLCVPFITFAQPGTNDDNSGLEGTDTPAAPIDDYVWVLAAIGLIYVFLRLKAFSSKGNASKRGAEKLCCFTQALFHIGLFFPINKK